MAGGGGAWKVAYADFVTAMMAFFLVMWICGQDQEIKRQVSYYFIDPFGDSSQRGTIKPTATGAVSEFPANGNLINEEASNFSNGRSKHTKPDTEAGTNQLLKEHIFEDKENRKYWETQAAQVRASLQQQGNGDSEELASRQLASQLRQEFANGCPFPPGSMHRGMFNDAISNVDWSKIAKKLLNSDNPDRGKSRPAAR